MTSDVNFMLINRAVNYFNYVKSEQKMLLHRGFGDLILPEWVLLILNAYRFTILLFDGLIRVSWSSIPKLLASKGVGNKVHSPSLKF
jgi:hypothetical protein